MNPWILLGLLIAILGLALAAINVTWTRFHPGWAALALIVFVYLIHYVGIA